MKKGVLYLALKDVKKTKEQYVLLERERTAGIFLEMNEIECVHYVTDSENCSWEVRTGMLHILDQIEQKQIAVDCIVVWSYWELIHQQRDFDTLKRKLKALGIELISITRGEIEIESDYYCAS